MTEPTIKPTDSAAAAANNPARSDAPPVNSIDLEGAIGVLNGIRKKFKDLEIKTNREAARIDSKGAEDVLNGLKNA